MAGLYGLALFNKRKYIEDLQAIHAYLEFKSLHYLVVIIFNISSDMISAPFGDQCVSS